MDAEKVMTAFENEDLVFSLKSGELLKINKRVSGFLDSQLFNGINSLNQYQEIFSRYTVGNKLYERKELGEGNDFLLESTILFNDKIYNLNELVWVDREELTLHIFIFLVSENNVFELPEKSMIEIVDKMPGPAILFTKDLSKVIIANAPIIELLNQPISQLVKGFSLNSFFAEKAAFSKMVNWCNDQKNNRLTIQAKLFLKNQNGNWFDINLFKARIDEVDCILCLLKDIDKDKADQLKLKRSNNLLTKIVEVQKHFLAQESGDKPYQLLLTNMLSVIEASLGFIGEVIDHKGKKVLKIHAATDISSDGPIAAQLYHKYLKEDFLFQNLDNLFGACITESKVILENNPPSNPHTKGNKIPGHPQINNFLGVPIFKKDEVIGLIGLGNKEGGFAESDIQDLRPFASTYSVIIEAFNFEVEKIKYEKESFEKALILSKVADYSPDLIVMVNENFELEYISKAAEKFLEKGVLYSAIPRKVRALLKKSLQEKYKVSKDLYQSRLQIRTKGGNKIWLESMVSLIEENNENKLIAIIRDVSVQVQIEDNLKLSLKKEREFNSFVSDFMNTVSHEFKTPLATIMSSLEITQHYLSDSSASHSLPRIGYHCRKIQTEVNNLHQLIAHSLDYNRFANQGAKLKKAKVSFRGFIEDCLNKYGLLNSIEYTPEVSHSFEVMLDKFLIETSLVNIMTNAIKYGSDSKPTLRLFFEDQKFGFTVSDRGIGIKKEELAYIFTPFFRGSNVRGIEGTGFGLVAVKNFVEIHGGTIKIESDVNIGTRVEVQIPI